MIAALGLWAHLAAALLYGALAFWAWRHGGDDRRAQALVAAFTIMALWSAAQALTPASQLAQLAEAARNIAFLTFMYAVQRDARPRALGYVYAAVAALAGLQVASAVLPPDQVAVARSSIGAVLAAGALVLVHNLYAQAVRASRWGIRLPTLALAAMWGFDLHLYTVASVTRAPVNDLLALRGVIAVMLVPLFAVATRRNSGWRVQLSRTATFRALSLVALAGYFVLTVSLTRALPAEGEWVRLAQAALILVTLAGALLLLPSDKARAWIHVLIAKHLFEHRYDYREDWLRFSRTIGQAGTLGVDERVVKALAELAGSPGGMLLQVGDGDFRAGARWNWRGEADVDAGAQPEAAEWLARTGFIIDFAAPPGGGTSFDMLRAGDAWAGVPLVHGERLLGLVLLEAPSPHRPLDWEDFDLLRAAGSQAASHLAEAQGQEALGEARRFDEFNRRFAFIMHDIKNLVSQLSLVTRNAERHADNPEFRADMIATLQASVKKMNDLLARLAREGGGDAGPLRPLPVRSLLGAVAEAKRRIHPVVVSGDPALYALADWARLEQAVAHLVQNGMEASAAGQPVQLSCRSEDGMVAIEVRDSGRGMSEEFVRVSLFKPFLSTKDTGFGIGAYEARSLIAAMGGRLEVESHEGEGSRFTISLRRADAPAAPQSDRISA